MTIVVGSSRDVTDPFQTNDLDAKVRGVTKKLERRPGQKGGVKGNGKKI